MPLLAVLAGASQLTAPAELVLPSGQASQVLLPIAVVNVFGAHELHDVDAGADAYEPRGQNMQLAAAFASLNVPGEQISQKLLLIAVSLLLANFPLLHGVHAEAPASSDI